MSVGAEAGLESFLVKLSRRLYETILYLQKLQPMFDFSYYSVHNQKSDNKVVSYSLPSVGPGADPGVHTCDYLSHPRRYAAIAFHQACSHDSQPKNVTVLRPVPSYSAW